MATKYQHITGLYETAIRNISKPDEWTSFLRSACRNYRCRFDEQVLIHAQRPDATAVLEIEKWNRKFGRWVNRGARGIAVFDGEPGAKTRLKHYFDISDTHGGEYARPVPVWSMKPEYEADIIETLENAFGELAEKETLAEALLAAAKNAVDDNLPDYLEQLNDCREDSFLEELDDLNLEVMTKNALFTSVGYMLLTRCGIDGENFFDVGDFQDIYNFNTPATVNILGAATSDIAEMGLREISSTILALQKEEKNRTLVTDKNVAHNEGIIINDERGFDHDRTDIQQTGRLSDPRPDAAGGRRSNPWEIRVKTAGLPEKEQEGALHQPADNGQAERAPGGNRADGVRADGAYDQTDGGGAGRDRGTESQRPDGMGRNAEQHPAQRGGNDTGGADLQLTLLPSVEEQISLIEQAEDEKTSAFSISQQIIDEVLTSGGNEENSVHRIVSYFKKDHTLADNADFLGQEYGSGGKGFIFSGNHVAVWWGENGIHAAVGDTALNASDAALVTWEQAAKRIRELLDMGRYAPQSELDKADGVEIMKLAVNLWDIHHDLADGVELPFFDDDLFKGGFPDSTARIAELVAQPQGQQTFLDGLMTFAKAYVQDKDLLRFPHSSRYLWDAIITLTDLQREPLVFTADESVSTARPGFITQDEVDRVLCGGGNVQHGKFRIYSYFLQSHTAKEKADFLKNEYGWGGSSRTGFSEMYDGKGISYSRENNHMPYDKVVLPWGKAARRIDELIADGRYMSQAELDYIPEYEIGILAGEIHSFFYNQPEDVPRPYPYGAGHSDGVKAIRPQLDEPERVAEILNSMAAILDNTADFDNRYESMRKAFDDLAAYQNDTFSLFTPALPAEKETTAPMPKAPEPSTADAAAEYDLHLGAAVYIGADEYEIYSLDDTHVVLRDMKYPLFTKEMPRDEFDRKLRENRLNDGLIKTVPDPPMQQPEPNGDAELKEQIRKVLDLRGYAVSDELIGEGLEEYDNRGGTGNHKDIADFIERAYLTEEETLESYIGNRYEIDGREFVVESVDEEFDEIELRDITFQDSVGFPIFHSVSLDYILQHTPIKEKPQESPAEKETPPTEPIWEQTEGGEVTRVRIDLVPEDGQPAEKEESLTPAWEQSKRRSRVQTFDQHPEIPMSERHNFVITDDSLGHGGAKTKFQNNITAIRLLKRLDSENRFATPEEQEVLSRFVGWGGLPQAFDPDNKAWGDEYSELNALLSPEEYNSARATTLNAHYTSPTVIRAIYKAIENMGFKSGNIIDPGCGIGNFQGLLPESMKGSKVFGIEIDPITGRIAQQLYQKNSIAIQGYENTDLPDSFFDLAIGNVPFGGYGVADRKYDKHKFLIHDYFFAKTLDKVRPGGIVAFITSKGTMDKQNPEVRKYIAQRADLLGAIRLPNNAFKDNAGTEVTTDIIFLQKRDRIIDIEPDWVHLGETENGIPVNSYFVGHPDMMLGEMANEDGVRMYGNTNSTSCLPYPGSNLSEQLADAIQNIHAEITDHEMDELSEDEDKSIPADPDTRNFSYTVVDGKLYFRENSRMNPVEMSVTATSRVKGMIEIRDCVRSLLFYQTEDYPDVDIKTEQAKLNRLYDSFTRKYGIISERANSMAFSDDSAYPLLCSLEILDENGRFVRKADMFTKRTIKPQIAVTSVDTASEALAVSIAEKACVDLGFMASLMGGSEKIPDIVEDLKGIIFKDPNTGPFDLDGDDWDKGWQTADEYLSGNVREKLRVAGELAETHPEFVINYRHLEAVQPKDLTAPEISVRLGATWLPPDVIRSFIFELLDTAWRVKDKVGVLYSPLTAEWNVTGKSADGGNIKAVSTYGTRRINAYWIIENTLNLRDVRIYDTIYEDGKETRVLNKKETAIAQDKQDIIKAKFAEWIWKDPARRERLCKLYNEQFNSIRPREYDGQHIKFAGMNPEIKLDRHQINAAARHLYGGNSLYGHVVGAGKSFEMIAAAMESKRLGLSNKAMFVVPNNIIGDFAADFFRLYPSANILMATKKDFEKKNRKKFCARIATGDYDGIIIGHSQFEKIPVSVERQRQMLKRQIWDITRGIADVKAQNGERYTIKQMEKSRKALEVKLKKLNDQSRKDDLVTFEELGVDRLFVDEADLFKNLYLITKMRNVGGIAQTEAQKASDLFMKTRYLDELTGNRGVVFATGTPVSNTMAELYTMQRYLQYDTLVKNNMQHFDCWASTFGETVTAMELTPEGTGFQQKTRFANFYNLPELMAMFKEVADIQTADMLNLPVPKANYHVITTKPSEMQQEMVAGLSERADKIRKREVDATEDNMLLITNDGRKLALDQRIINPMLPDFEGSKVNACVGNVYRIWDETREKRLTQLIFSDLSTPKGDGSFSVYNDIKAKLLAKGVPENEIAFIHEANNEAQKKELFAKVRTGKIRILLGSTTKMGAGTNVQDKLIALHDLDCPWRPRDLEQRAGRIVRRGNKNPEVDIYRYVTEGTFDAYLYQMIENKQKFISQVFTSKSPARVMQEIDDSALSYAEIKALATGNPLIIERCNLEAEVNKLNMLKGSHLSQRYDLEDKVIKHYPAEITRLEERVAGYKADIERLTGNTPADKDAFPPMRIGETVYTDKKDAGNAIIEACKAMTSPDPVPIGVYRGFEMELSFDSFSKEYRVTLKGQLSHKVSLGSDIHGNITRIDNVLEGIEPNQKGCEEQLAAVRTQLETAKIEAEAPFSREQELQEKTARLAELTIALKLDEKDREILDGAPDEGDKPPVKNKGYER